MHSTAVERRDEPVVELVASRTGPKKITADRLRRVENLQAQLTECAVASEQLAEEELNGWVVGNPQTQVSARAEPLQDLAMKLYQAVEALEALYS